MCFILHISSSRVLEVNVSTTAPRQNARAGTSGEVLANSLPVGKGIPEMHSESASSAHFKTPTLLSQVHLEIDTETENCTEVSFWGDWSRELYDGAKGAELDRGGNRTQMQQFNLSQLIPQGPLDMGGPSELFQMKWSGGGEQGWALMT